MAARIDQNSHIGMTRSDRRPLWLSILACFSLLLGIITAIPQFYYVLFALHKVTIGPDSNFLGQIWYDYILNGDNSYYKVDPGILAGAVEDAFLLGPFYFVTGLGLWMRRAWVIPVGLMTGAMIFYAIVGFFLGDIFAGLPSVTNDISYWASNLPYLIYPLWLIPVLLLRRSLFARTKLDVPVISASEQ
ncbi:MAG TPA: hypothetical protein VKV20_16275 [Ktedonobacteraceae bacterium]|jgi:hypothetical protein|nr:hypothetical protein [Ktedonobacteraceae bacterium]